MTITTRVGRSTPGDYDTFGLSVYRDLVGKTSFLGLVALAITGRKLSRDDELVLDDLAACYHVPEPRVWPMKIARIVASMGRPIPGIISAAIAVDSHLIGGRLTESGAQVLLDLEAFIGEHPGPPEEAAHAFVDEHPRLMGFGVPFRPFDERVVALRAVVESRGRGAGKYWKLGELFWKVARKARGLEVNILGASVALCLDLGFTVKEIAPLTMIFLEPTFIANAVEGAAQRSNELLELPAEMVKYVGPAPRRSPRAG